MNKEKPADVAADLVAGKISPEKCYDFSNNIKVLAVIDRYPVVMTWDNDAGDFAADPGVLRSVLKWAVADGAITFNNFNIGNAISILLPRFLDTTSEYINRDNKKNCEAEIRLATALKFFYHLALLSAAVRNPYIDVLNDIGGICIPFIGNCDGFVGDRDISIVICEGTPELKLGFFSSEEQFFKDFGHIEKIEVKKIKDNEFLEWIENKYGFEYKEFVKKENNKNRETKE